MLLLFFSAAVLPAIIFQYFIVYLREKLPKLANELQAYWVSFILDSGSYSTRNILRRLATETQIATNVLLPSRVLRDRFSTTI